MVTACLALLPDQAFSQTLSAVGDLNGDGYYLQWAPASGSTHYTQARAACGSTSGLSTTTLGARDSYAVNAFNVPLGSTITGVQITLCAASLTGQPVTLDVFSRYAGVDTAPIGALSVSGTTPTTQPAITISGLNILAATGLRFEAGVVLSSGTGGARINGVSVRYLYTPAPPFLPPSNVRVVQNGPRGLDVVWDDTNDLETGYRVERSTENETAWIVLGTTAQNATRYRDWDVAPDVTYYYRVRATRLSTGQESANSPNARGLAYNVAPPAPRNLAATAGATSIALSWQDTSRNEDGFEIERSTDGVSFQRVGTAAANATSFTHATAPGGAYSYRVRATNPIGASGWSNVASNVTAPASGPNLRLTLDAAHASTPNNQLTTFTLGHHNDGTATAPNVWVTTTVPTGGTYSAAASSPEWRCHNTASDSYSLTQYLGSALRAIKVRYPNVKQVFLTSHMYSGYVVTGGIYEPYGYEGGYASQRVVRAQIEQARSGYVDTWAGDLAYSGGGAPAPWVTWGAYDWANGTTPNGQGLSWRIPDDYAADYSHPSVLGATNVARLLLAYLLTAPETGWFRVATGTPIPILPTARPTALPIPLTDMLPGERYLGLDGGLFGGWSNVVPADHQAAGLAAAARIEPLDANGAPSATGKIGFISLGFSNSLGIFRELMNLADVDPRVRPHDRYNAAHALKILNEAGAGGTTKVWADPTSVNYDAVRTDMSSYGLSEAQVQVVWLNAANAASTILGPSMAATAAGTVCKGLVGSVAPGETRTLTFAVASTGSSPRTFNLSATAWDDGTQGTDLAPADNTASTTHVTGTCNQATGEGCDYCNTYPAPVCDDGDPCNGAETCVPTRGCVAGTAPTCDDGNPCTADACTRAGCTHTPVADGTSCSNGDTCDGAETCAAGVCAPGTPLACDDGDVCNGAESCSPTLGCVAGTPLACDDGDACNGYETCAPSYGCVAGTPLVCDDGDPCNGAETCAAIGMCLAGAPLVCDDGDRCNGAETCTPGLGCTAGVALACDDGDVCNGFESCSPTLGCVAGTPTACNTIGLPASAALTAVAQSTAAVTGSFALSNTGLGATMAWSAASDAPWLAISPSSGTTTGAAPITVSLTASAANMPVGTFTAHVLVTAPTAASSATLPVTLTVLAPPATELVTNGGFDAGAATPWVSFGAAASFVASGRDARSGSGYASFGTVNNGTGTMGQLVTLPAGAAAIEGSLWVKITSAETATWVADRFTARVTSASGATLATVASLSNLDAAAHASWVRKTIDLTPWAGQQVRVVFDIATDQQNATTFYVDDVSIRTGGPVLAASAASLGFDTARNLDPAPQSVALTNAGLGALAWSAASDASWLSVSPASGVAPSTLTVSPHVAGLAAGAHDATITLTPSGAPGARVSLPVHLVVQAGVPVLTVAPAALGFSGVRGGPAPASQSVTIADAGEEVLVWTAASDAAWLHLGASSGTGPSSVELTADPSGLGAGDYTTHVTVTAAGAAGSPLVVPVTLHLDPPPTLAVSPAGAIALSATEGGIDPSAVSLAITNAGSGTLAWSASSNASWLAASASAGVAPSTLAVQVSIAGLGPGSYAGELTITAPGADGAPLVVPVALTVTSRVVEWVTNGGFEAGTTPWMRFGNGVRWVGSGGEPYAGVGYVEVGSAAVTSNVLGQVLALPAGAASLTLSYAVKMTTAETTTAFDNDRLTVKLQNGTTGATLATLAVYGNRTTGLGSWRRETFDLTPWAGRTVGLSFEVVTNDGLATTFSLDAVSVLSR